MSLTALSLVALLASTAVQPASETAIQRIGMGSCINPREEMTLWDGIKAAKPEVFLWLGDNVYVDGRTSSNDHKTEYDILAAQDGFKWLRANTIELATWDDHDYGINDAGVEYPKKVEAQTAFLDFWGVAEDSPRRDRKGIYHSVIMGPVGKRTQFIMLDTRYHRSALKRDEATRAYLGDEDPTKTMLGAEQWAWLGEQLKQPAELRVIASSIQVVSEEHRFEKWMNLPLERAKLFNLIKETEASGVVFVSGDRHLSDLSVMDAGVGYPIYDLTSSALNRSNKGWRMPEQNKHRLVGMQTGDNFGMIQVEWNEEDPLVSMQIRDGKNEIIGQTKIRLSWLKPGRIRAR